ncbi:hypothetical protein CDCA_CDCA11G3194 [Cyanidium caldarium]|uniref:AAA+ ATPase domain-containing protein n=1 Tax=Cyanidium caldarium TaxID=2771 RepID=A0AAV9IYI9_CYACA|nr:hypothetical protein CDCA_CDCA11G3194 [Cyanidium caldarium]
MNGSRGNGQSTRHDSSRCPRCARLQGTGWALVREDALPPDVEPGTICVLNCRAVCLVWTTPKREEDSLPAWHYDETVVRDGRCVADNVETAAAHSSPLYSTALSDVSIRCLGACRPARHIVLQRCAPASSPPDTPFGWERAVRADLLFLPVMRDAVVSRRWRVFDISGSDNWVAPSTRISVAPAETPPPPPELARGRASAITAPTLDTPLARRLAQCLSQPRCQLQAMGARAIRGVLLCGPPGVGKTHTVGQVVRALRMPLKEVSADATAGTAAAARLHQAYHEAAAAASSADAPAAILFIDELDRLCPKRRDVVGGIDAAAATALLLTIMDGVGSAHPRLAHRVMVVGATNDPDGVDEALRRPGRFDEEIHIAAPTEQERRRLLEALGAAPEEAARLATQTPGYVAADLVALAQHHFQLQAVRTPALLRHALAMETPALDNYCPQRDGYESIGGYDGAKQALRQAIEWPLRYRHTWQRLHLRPARGVLLHGPPGCCKTKLVRAAVAAASAAGIRVSFLRLSGAELYSAYLGESERTLREAFTLARAVRPAVLFLDELDSLVGARGSGTATEGAADVRNRLLGTLLTEMDGIQSTAAAAAADIPSVLVVAATNRLDRLDAALLRPGRFDTHIAVPLPDAADRRAIWEMFLGRHRSSELEVALDAADMEALVQATAGCSGAHLEQRWMQAAVRAARDGRHVIGYVDLVPTPLPASVSV